MSDPTVQPRPARYDEVVDFYLAEMGEVVTDPGTAALLELVGPVDGRRVLDLACGHGRVTRELIGRGATVTGLDISDALLDRARAAEQVAPLGARYVHGDAAGSVDLPAGSFDSVVCNYGLSDIDDLTGALANVHTLLRPGGAFVFSLLHPCFPGWGNDVASSWPPGHGYFAELIRQGFGHERHAWALWITETTTPLVERGLWSGGGVERRPHDLSTARENRPWLRVGLPVGVEHRGELDLAGAVGEQ